MSFVTILSILVMGIITDNIILNQSIGMCSFLGVSKKTSSAYGMGIAVTFVLVLSSLICYGLYNAFIVPLDIGYLSIVLFVLVIAAFVQLLDIVLKRISPNLYNSLGIYLSLITTNCAVLFVVNQAILIDLSASGVLEVFLTSLSMGIGFTLAIILMAGIRERLATADIPKVFKGFPITLIAAGLMAMAFAGFAGMAF